MRLRQTQLVTLVVLLCVAWAHASTRSGGGVARVPMSSLKTLYFRDGAKTLARRGKSMPQLKCVGNSKHLCSTYGPDIIMCKSEGDGAWRCEADLHPDVRLGAVEVSCEGWENAADEYVMRGSCMLEYNILPAYAAGKSQLGLSSTTFDSIVATLFFFAFFIVLAYIVYSFFKAVGGYSSRGTNPARGWGGWGGFGPGGGGGGDAPPAYYPHQKPNDASSSAWRPGFWSGLAAGGLATHAANRLRQPAPASSWGAAERRRAFFDDDDNQPMFRQAAAGPSRSRGPSSETRTSTNFGGTRNR